jgi:hypothetical protein
VRIGRCANPAEATLLRSLFDAHGIPVAINGEQHAAMLGGLGGAFIPLDVTVAADDAERARELFADFEQSRVEVEADASDDEPDEADDLPVRLELRKRIGIAIMLAFFVSFGTAHLSAGAYKRAITLATIEVFGIYSIAIHDAKLGASVMALAVLCDAIGAVRTIRRRFAQRVPVARVRR